MAARAAGRREGHRLPALPVLGYAEGVNPASSAGLAEAVEFILSRSPHRPQIGVVLGSGLGAYADTLSDATRIPYEEVPHLPRSTVAGHPGNLWMGRSGAATVACLQGRVHLYEGHAPSAVVFGVRLLAALGCRAVLLTNAAGGIADELAPGDLMLITDHLNLMGQSPLVGPPPTEGPRFPDMTQAYDPQLGQWARGAAGALGIELKTGIYAALLGPSYETPAEIRMLRLLGAHAVGMSTVPEVIALRQLGVPVAAISCITNKAAGLGAEKLDHAEVQLVADRSRQRFLGLLTSWVQAIHAGVAHD